jgi:hypothetical protein
MWLAKNVFLVFFNMSARYLVHIATGFHSQETERCPIAPPDISNMIASDFIRWTHYVLVSKPTSHGQVPLRSTKAVRESEERRVSWGPGQMPQHVPRPHPKPYGYQVRVDSDSQEGCKDYYSDVQHRSGGGPSGTSPSSHGYTCMGNVSGRVRCSFILCVYQ